MNAMTAKQAQVLARVGGALYLLIIVLGACGEAVVRGRIVRAGNAAQTATNLDTMEWLWRLGVAGELTLLVSTGFLAVILYALLRPVSRQLALTALVLNIVVVAIEGVAAVSLASALFPLTGQSYLNAFTPEQLNALSLLFIKGHTYGFAVALIFFGAECVVLGVLIYRASYIPRVIGVLMQVAGGCYMVNSFALILSPQLSSVLFPLILLPALVGELSLTIWLLARGVRPNEWNLMALHAARASASLRPETLEPDPAVLSRDPNNTVTIR